MTNAPTKPENLDPTKLHSPSEVAAWKQASHDYFVATRKIASDAEAAIQAAQAHASRILSSDEYFALAVERKAKQDAVTAERIAAEKAFALSEIDRKLQSPPVADVMARNEYTFLQEVIMWSARGYTLEEGGLINFGLGHYHIQMTAPKKAAK